MGKKTELLKLEQSRIHSDITSVNFEVIELEQKIEDLKSEKNEKTAKKEELAKSIAIMQSKIEDDRNNFENVIKQLNEQYKQDEITFVAPNENSIVIKCKEQIIDAYIFNKEAKEWEYSDSIPNFGSFPDTKTRINYFKKADGIYNIISEL